MSATLSLSRRHGGDRYGLITLARVVVLIALATLIWVPVGVWIGLRPKLAERVQPVAQFLAAFPANLAFPVFVVIIVRYSLGSQYLAQPADDPRHAVVYPVQRHRRRQRVSDRPARGRRQFPSQGLAVVDQGDLPGIFPYYITGAITASGGSWNASIVAEVASWGNTRLTADGLGAYIALATEAGDFRGSCSASRSCAYW